MNLFSFITQDNTLLPINVEISLIPGLPNIHIIGMADAQIKESRLRIISALKSQGFQIPIAQQVLINLTPSNIKKSSSGLDIAIAYGILWATEQLTRPEFIKPNLNPSNNVKKNTNNNKNNNISRLFLYGALRLDGSIDCPKELDWLAPVKKNDLVITGLTDNNFPFVTVQLKDLNSLHAPLIKNGNKNFFKAENNVPNIKLSKKMARLAKIIALGGFHSLFAGTPGVGKTTLAKALKHLMPSPSFDDLVQINRWRFSKDFLKWRPMVSPHHSSSALSILGGGIPVRPGALTRAHEGLLLLDEYLEFPVKVQEALREPIELSSVHIFRGSQHRILPAKFQLVSTTNLCGCGKWIPLWISKKSKCRCSVRKITTYHERIKGPVLDRFEIFQYFHKDIMNEQRNISLNYILEELEVIRKSISRISSRILVDPVVETDKQKILMQEAQVSKKINVNELALVNILSNRPLFNIDVISKYINKDVLKILNISFSSERRKNAFFKVCFIIYLLDNSENLENLNFLKIKISEKQALEAWQLSVQAFLDWQ